MNDAATQTLVHERENFTESSRFYVTPDDIGPTVPGPGSLDTLLVVADNNSSFGVNAETGTTNLVNDGFTKLETWSDELDHISAYTTANNKMVLSLTDFPFRRFVRAQVTVSDTIDFDWVRAVYVTGDEVDY